MHNFGMKAAVGGRSDAVQTQHSFKYGKQSEHIHANKLWKMHVYNCFG